VQGKFDFFITKGSALTVQTYNENRQFDIPQFSSTCSSEQNW